MSKWGLYVILLLTASCFFITESSEKNRVCLTDSISIEFINSDLGEKTSLKTISPEEAKAQSFDSNSVSGTCSSQFSTPETIPVSEPASIYSMKNVVTNITCSGFPRSSILAAGDIIHYQITITNNANCCLRNVTLTDAVVTPARPGESINKNGIMEPNETWTYTGSYIVSQYDINTNGNGSGIIENTATVDCDQFDPLSSTATVPIAVSSGCLPTFEAVVNYSGIIKLKNSVVVGSSFPIFTKNGKVLFGVLNPGKSWAPIDIFNATSDNSNSNDSSNIASAESAAYNQVNYQSSRVKNIYTYRIIQPVSPPLDYFSNNSYLGESCHYVGADGHTITLVNNESAVDPTYSQLVEFIKRDKTNEIPYNNTSFVCSDVAERVHNNAEAIGFRCAWVYIYFTNEQATLNQVTNALVVGHACNLFNTTDKGLVAIDCTGGSFFSNKTANIDLSKWDNEVSLVKNGEYTPRLLYSFPGSDKLKEFLSMGTIADFYPFW